MNENTHSEHGPCGGEEEQAAKRAFADKHEGPPSDQFAGGRNRYGRTPRQARKVKAAKKKARRMAAASRKGNR